MLRRIDPMVRLVLAATLLATVLPATGGARVIAQGVSDVAVFLLFLFFGLRLSRDEVWAGLGNHRLLWPLTLWVFGAMTLAGWATWQLSAPLLPPTLALGFLYLGVLPSTVQSATAYSAVAGGNVASSVVAAALVNIIGVFVSAPLFTVIAGGKAAGFHGEALVKVMTMLLLPFIVGQAAQGLVRHWVSRHRASMAVLDRTSIGIAVYVAFSGAVEQGVLRKFDPGSLYGITLGTAALLVVGYGGSWLLSRVLGLPRPDRISLLFAGAQKSVAMGAPLAMVLFPPATAGTILLPLLVYHLAQMIVAAPIAARLRNLP